MNKTDKAFCWVGSQRDFVDHPDILTLQHLIIGRYGGNSKAGQYKNEDGCLVWIDSLHDWEFVILLDAHNTAESAELVLSLFENNKIQFTSLLSPSLKRDTFKMVEQKILELFQTKEFLSACRQVTGETACLLVIRKGKYVWWFSVGDCVLYVLHPELAKLRQYQVNQRQFYEWIGQVNTFEQDIPCYTIGLKELRKGENQLFLTTDGLLECPNEPYADPQTIYAALKQDKVEVSIQEIFTKLIQNNVRDSTTVISWKVTIADAATKASNQ